MRFCAVAILFVMSSVCQAQRPFVASELCLVEERPVFAMVEPIRVAPPETPALLAYAEPVRETVATRIVCNGKTCQRVAVAKPVAVWNGRTYTSRVCSSPGCRMCNSISNQLRTTTATPVRTSKTVGCVGVSCSTSRSRQSGWYPGKLLFGGRR